MISFLIFLLGFGSAFGADSTPHMNTKVCNPGETRCADVYSDGSVEVRRTGLDANGNTAEDRISGILDSNSSTAPLGSGGVFTGSWADVSGYADAAVTVFSDQPSSTDGFLIQQSMNCSTPRKSDPYTISANDASTFSIGLNAKCLRVVYTNGATPQSTFELQTKLFTRRPKPSSHRIEDAIDGQNDAELAKAVITGKDPDGNFVNDRFGGRKSSFSTTAPLGSGGTFSSPVESTAGYLTVDFTVFSNVAGANDGITIEWCLDASCASVIKESNFSYLTAGQGSFYNVPIQGPFARLSYTNAAVAQSSFFLDTRFRTDQQSGIISQIESTLTGDLLAMLARVVLFGRTEGGDLLNVALSNSGSLKVAVTDRPSEVRNRIRRLVPINRTSLTGAGTIYFTVTPGHTLYVQSFQVSALNTSSSDGEFILRDNETTIIPFLIPSRISGSSPSAFSITAPTLPEPIPFSTNVNFTEVTGNVEIAGYLIGYEEPN